MVADRFGAHQPRAAVLEDESSILCTDPSGVWEAAASQTIELIERFGAQLNAGTLDTMHVALARLSGCTWFLSFDTNSNARVLAVSARLRVFPLLSATEKARVVTPR